MLARLLDAGLAHPPALRWALLGGGPIAPALLERAERAGVPVAPTYGMTEACSQIATFGWPLAGVELQARRRRARDQGPRADRRAGAKPTPTAGCTPATSVRSTSAAGCEITGRKADTIVSGGENVAPAEVEAVLLEHPAVADAAVFGRTDPEWGEAIVARVVLRDGLEAEPEELRPTARRSWPGSRSRRRSSTPRTLPRTPSGKLLRRELAVDRMIARVSTARTLDDSDSPNQLTIEQLAAQSGMSVRNIRAHQARGLLSPPEVRMRVGYYGPEHVSQLRLIRELQNDGFNLGGIKRLLEDTEGTAERLFRFKDALSASSPTERAETITLRELARRFRVSADEAPEVLAEAERLGVIVPIGEHLYEVPSPSLLAVAEEVVDRGVSLQSALAVLDEIERHLDSVSRSFVDVFLAEVWKPFQQADMPPGALARDRGRRSSGCGRSPARL